jgi:lipoyl(octanoyl) transferase
VGYDEALEMQRTLVEERKADLIPDTLLLLEHPHVLTLGVRKGGGRTNILAPPARLADLGVTVFEAGRGGDVTYHGPGQLVGYPIIDLKPDRQDVHRYVRDLEAVMIRVCADFGVGAQRLEGFSGAWVNHPARGLEKVAAIGVRISRWVTSHGFALNVNTDLEFFGLIVPCGIADRGVTSLQAQTGAAVAIDRVETSVTERFAEIFSREVVSHPAGVMS